MRSWNWVVMIALLFGLCVPVPAEMIEKSVAVKVDYISFADGDLDDADVDSDLYVGLEGYTAVMGGLLHAGGEIGYAKVEGKVKVAGVEVDNEFKFIPIEANVKHLSYIGENLSWGLGLGISMMFVEADLRTLGVDEDNWLWGGQFFGEVNYTIGNLVLGIDAKYHLTESFKDDDYTNVRVGAHVGWTF